MTDIDKIIEKINKDVAKSSKDENPMLFRPGDRPDLVAYELIPCNVPELNKALGGGFATHHGHLISGAEGVGKTSIALSICKEVQARGKIVIYLCTEGLYPMATSELIGVDNDKIVVMYPKDFSEQNVDAIYNILFDSENRTVRPEIGAVVIDSINALATKSQIDRSEGDGSHNKGMAERARMISEFLDRVHARGLLRAGCILLIIAQLRVDLGAYGTPDTISGGKAPRYYGKTVTRLSKLKGPKGTVDGIVVPLGHKVRATISKNNISGQPTATEYTILYGIGPDDSLDLLTRGLETGDVTKEGRATYVFNVPPMGILKAEKKDGALDMLRSNPELRDALRDNLKGVAAAAPETDAEEA